MAKPNLDLKKLMLEKGERIGLGIAAGIAAVLVLIGLIAVFSAGTPSANAKNLRDKKNDLVQRQQNARPSPDSVEVDPALSKAAERPAPVEAETLRPAGVLFDSKRQEDKRRNPRVLEPEEWRAVVTLAQVRSYMVSDDGTKIMVLRSQGFQNQQNYNNQLSNFNKGIGGQGRQIGRGGTGTPDGGLPTPPPLEGGEGVPPPGSEAGAPPKDQIKAFPEDIAKAQNLANAKLAENALPLRVAVVMGSYPYKKQIEEFQQKLLYLTVGEMLDPSVNALPQFKGFEIEKCVFDASKSLEKQEWKPLDLLAEYKKLVNYFTGPRFEVDDPDVQRVLLRGLTMPRPLQFRHGQYPDPAELLPLIKKTLDDLKQADKPGRVETPKKGLGGDFDIFNPDGKSETAPPVDPTGGAIPPDPKLPPERGEGPGSPNYVPVQWTPPEYALVRFVDWNIKPGKVYAYRVKIKMTNPNYRRTDVAWDKLAKDKDLVSADWIYIPQFVYVPPEQYFYAVDMSVLEKNERKFQEPKATKDQVAIQVHRWLEEVIPNPANKNTKHPAAEWVVAERILVNRGDYLFRAHKTDVPYWAFQQDKLVLAVNPAEKEPREKDKGVLVDLTLQNNEPLLVDFEPAEQTHVRKLSPAADSDKPRTETIRDKEAVELLILAADGKLIVRDSYTDVKDKEREQRHKAWKDRVEEAKKGTKPSDKGPADPFKQPGGGGSTGTGK